MITLGASNTWFAAIRSALTLPREVDRLAQLVEEHWAVLRRAENLEFVRAFRAVGQINGFRAVHRRADLGRHSGAEHGCAKQDVRDLKTPEYEVFTNPAGAARSSEFRIREVAAPAACPALACSGSYWPTACEKSAR